MDSSVWRARDVSSVLLFGEDATGELCVVSAREGGTGWLLRPAGRR